MQILANYSYHRPSSLEEAWNLLTEESLIMAGGSDVMPQLKMATINPGAMIDLCKIKELQTISEEKDGIHIGSMISLSHLAKSPMILNKVPILSQAARNVASPQIRNRGTIGGNVLQARRCFYYNQPKGWRAGLPRCYKVGGEVCIQIKNSPVCRAIYYSDMAPALIALKAKVKARTQEGIQILDCESLLRWHCEDKLPKLILLEFIIPRDNYENAYARFCKYSLRGSIDFPIINFACLLKDDQVIFTVGAIACNVLNLDQTASYLSETGAFFDIEEATEIALNEMSKKSQLIREAGLSVNVKRASFKQIREILTDIHRQMNKK